MEKIYRKNINFISTLVDLSNVCDKYFNNPNEKNGNTIIDVVDECEKMFLEVKEEIVRMVKEVAEKKENDNDVSVQETNSGFLIKDYTL